MPTFKKGSMVDALAAFVCVAAAAVGLATMPSTSTGVREEITHAVVVMEASVSGGHRASPGAAWPDVVAQRLRKADMPVWVVNASISATRLLAENDEGGPSDLSRQETRRSLGPRPVAVACRPDRRRFLGRTRWTTECARRASRTWCTTTSAGNCPH